MTLAKPTFPAIYKVSPANRPTAWQRHFVEEKNKIFNLQKRAEQFQTKVATEAVIRKFGGKIETDFTIFPTKEMTKVSCFIILTFIEFDLICSSCVLVCRLLITLVFGLYSFNFCLKFVSFLYHITVL